MNPEWNSNMLCQPIPMERSGATRGERMEGGKQQTRSGRGSGSGSGSSLRGVRQRIGARYNATYAGTTAEKALGSYMLYNRLVGESDGGDLLPPEDFVKLKELAKRTAPNRLFVSWTTKEAHASGTDCYLVGPDSRCFCGHSYKAHAWWDTSTKRVACRCPGCECKGFRYVNGHGTWWIKCECKHGHEDHRTNGVMGPCKVKGCNCRGFYSPFSCVCGAPWGSHRTVIQTKQERLKLGMAPVENLMGARDVGEAAAGGITRFTSLLPGTERRQVERPLPMTDVVLPALRDSLSSAPAALSGGGGGGGGGGRAVMGMAPVRELEPDVSSDDVSVSGTGRGQGEGGARGRSGQRRLALGNIKPGTAKSPSSSSSSLGLVTRFKPKRGGSGGGGGSRVDGVGSSSSSSPLVVDERVRKGRSWCTAAEGGGETQWVAARGASEALAEALMHPEAAPIAAALAQAAGGEVMADQVRSSRVSGGGPRSGSEHPHPDPDDHVLVGSSNIASQLRAAVAKFRGSGNGGGGGGGKVLVGRQGSMQGRNGLPVVLEPLPAPPPQEEQHQQHQRHQQQREQRRGGGGFKGGGRSSGGGKGTERGSRGGARGPGPSSASRGGGGGGGRRFRMKLVLGGVAPVNAVGGDGAEVEGYDSPPPPPLAEESSRNLYGGATGVRGMDVDRQKLQLSQAFWGGYGRGAKGLKPSHNH